MNLEAIQDRIGFGIHLFHGTRGLAIGAAALLVLGLVDPLFSVSLSRAALVVPVFAILVTGGATLAREGVAAQQRARRVLEAPDAPRRLAGALVWPVVLVLLLAPRVFLAAYGVPHLSPLTGLVLPAVHQRLTHGYLFATLLVTVLALRATRRYAKHVIPKRPKDLSRHDQSHQERDSLLWMSLGIAVGFGFLLHPFWAPFSLLQWPPALDSLGRVSGVASIAFSIAVPLLLFTTLTAYAAMLRVARDAHRGVIALAVLHIVLLLTAAVMHAYDLLWIAQYRVAAPF